MMIQRGYLREYRRPFDWAKLGAFVAGVLIGGLAVWLIL